MAARTMRPFHTAEIRAKIQASQLINRLTDHVFGKVELTPAQVSSANILLKKSVPDLQAVDLTGLIEHAVSVKGALTWQPPQA